MQCSLRRSSGIGQRRKESLLSLSCRVTCCWHAKPLVCIRTKVPLCRRSVSSGCARCRDKSYGDDVLVGSVASLCVRPGRWPSSSGGGVASATPPTSPPLSWPRRGWGGRRCSGCSGWRLRSLLLCRRGTPARARWSSRRGGRAGARRRLSSC